MKIFVIAFIILLIGYFDALLGDEAASGLALDLIQQVEGFSAVPYPDNGRRSIGYGTKALPEDTRITEGDARRRMKTHLEDEVLPYLKGEPFASLQAHQRAALTSFIYNVGAGNWMDSTLRKRLLKGDLEYIPSELARWKYVGGEISKGLIRRRAAEIKMWLKGP